MPVDLPMVRLRQVRKRAFAPSAGTRMAALDGLSLEVAAGETLSLLGPSGAGKTSVLMLLAGFARPDSGEIFLDGRRVEHTPPQRRGIGMVFPTPALFTHLNLAENVAFALRHDDGLFGRRRAPAGSDTRVAAALARVGLGGLGGLMPAQLSPEQQHRAALARALSFAPKLLLLDEPFAQLDPAARERLQDLLHALPGTATTIIHATSDAAEALAVADRIAVLDRGELLQIGPAQTLYDAPNDLRVARLLGPVNAIPGRVEALEDDLAVVRLACGPVVEALAIDVAAGVDCMVAIRPERIAVAGITAEELGDGAMSATVLEMRARGDHTRLRLAIGEPGGAQAELIVQRPAGVPLSGLQPGQEAAIAWQPHHARAFAPNAADGGT